MRRLPPFAELVAFEAVARHLSFTQAARELCVTQSAISHRVRRLEKHFDAQLVRRLNPGVELTDAGASLLPELRLALDALARVGQRERRLRVAAASSLCTWWLAGRLAQFMAQRPGISIDLVPIENDRVVMPEVDVRVLWTRNGEDAQSPAQQPLVNEDVFPVCSPKLLTRGQASIQGQNPGQTSIPGRPSLSDAQLLAALPLLHKATHATGEWSWGFWLDRLGMDVGKRRGSELRFADMGLLMSAAIDGAGVALTRSLLAHDALRDGRLIVPLNKFDPRVSVKRHVVRWRRARADDPDINALVSWLVAEAAATITDTRQLIRSGEAHRQVDVPALSLVQNGQS